MRYTVPQFIDVEDKIIGPITGRQFVILLAAATIEAILWKLLDFTAFLVFGILLLALAGVLAFLRVNGQPFHYFLLNLLQTFRRPGIRVWDKALLDQDLRDILRAPPPPPPRVRIQKAPLAATKLTELSLVVNTGGTYNPED